MRLLALLSAVLIAVLWASPRGLVYLCSMDGQRHAKCCCAPRGEEADSDHDRVERTACCDVERDTTNVSPAVAPSSQDDDRHLASASWTVGLDTDRMASSVDLVPALARGPPRAEGAPPYLRHCRFLI